MYYLFCQIARNCIIEIHRFFLTLQQHFYIYKCAFLPLGGEARVNKKEEAASRWSAYV